MEDLIIIVEEKVNKAIENMERANPAILDGVMVNYYGSLTPLKSLATI